MKFVIIPYIALGFTLSSLIGINYYCEGLEMFPSYYGSPFVFKQKSLGSSMTYFYSVSGTFLNVGVWSILIILIRKVLLYLIEKAKNKKLGYYLYKGLIVVLIAYTTLNVALNYLMLGNGFEKGSNYWYMNIDKEAKAWGMNCEGEWTFFNPSL